MRMFTKSGHITEESLGLHVVRDLPPTAGARVEEHLATCESCQGLWAEMEEIVSVLHEAGHGRPVRHSAAAMAVAR